MIGHSTVLIEIAGLRILTDPFFGEGNLAYRRLCAPARTREELRDVDLVLLSHHHFDHVDGRFLRLRASKRSCRWARRRIMTAHARDTVIS